MRISPLLLGCFASVSATGSRGTEVNTVDVTKIDAWKFSVTQGETVVVEDFEVLVGELGTAEYDASLASASGHKPHVDIHHVTGTVLQLQIDAPKSGNVGVRLPRRADERIYGVWSYPWNGSLANDGISYEVKGIQSETGLNYCNARAPFYITSAGYGVYVDTLQMGNFDFSEDSHTQFVFNSTSLSIYFIFPESPNDIKSILSQYGDLSSTVFMPPDSAFGPVIFADDWNEAFSTPDIAVNNYYNVTDHLYKNKIRASSLFADRPYGTGNGSWGNFDFDPTNYPHPKSFVDDLHDMGYDFQVWVSNRATPDTLLWNASIAGDWQFDYDPFGVKGGLIGPALNLSIPEAYDWFKKHMEYFPSVDVRGYKIDRGEEEEMPSWEQNIQQGLAIKMFYESMVEKWGESNFFNFARSANDRSRSHTAVWGGDCHANFTGLEYSVAAGIRSGLVGFAMWGSDTGGYVRKGEEQIPPTTKQPPTEEVFARWMQFSTFSPMYELLLGQGGTPWFDYSDDLVTIFAETAALHHELLPYIRSYIYGAHKNGLPVMRALFLEHPEDEKTWTPIADTEYFFGEQFLVAPIVAAGGKRDVYFPGSKDIKYIDYGTKTKVHRGGSTETVEVGLHDNPVYIKAGSIIPRGDVFRANALWDDDWAPWLNIQIFPSWSVPQTKFAYYNKGINKAVDIVVTSDRVKKEVNVQYGALGHPGDLVFYTKSGSRTVRLDPDGGHALLQEVDTLFE